MITKNDEKKKVVAQTISLAQNHSKTLAFYNI
jgi:hypothetical protein